MQDLAEIIAQEVAKQLPVKEAYTDLASPAARQLGRAAEDIAKTLRIALLPFQLAGAWHDKVSALIDRSIRNVPQEDRVAPQPQILGPAVEAVKYEEVGSPIFQMFEELLARSFSEKEASLAHPSYPAVIRQLSADEARLLQALAEAKDTPRKYERRFTEDFDDRVARFFNRKLEYDGLPREFLEAPDNMSFYIDHLHSMGLAGLYEYEKQQPIIRDNRQIGTRVFEELSLTAMGKRFMLAVGTKSKA